MKILAIDTCGGSGGIAAGLISPGGGASPPSAEILAEATLAGRSYSSQLIPRIGELLAASGLTMEEVEAIVVVNGPGSFTGIRVGLSTAKGLAEAANIPLLAVSRLALFAGASGLAHALVLLDAGRGDCYAGEYRKGRRIWERLMSDEETASAALEPGAGIVVCEAGGEAAAPAGPASIAALAKCGPVYVPSPGAAGAIRCALQRLLDLDFDDVANLDANYLRRSDAERMRLAVLGTAAP